VIEPNPAQQAKEVKLWFPLPNLPFLNSPSVLSFSPKYGSDGIGRDSIVLTPDPNFPLVDGKKTVIPIAIYADVDEGQDPGDPGSGKPGNRKGVFHQAGVQMVDGAHSHPECNVGP
jgi:hypothetical protein